MNTRQTSSDDIVDVANDESIGLDGCISIKYIKEHLGILFSSHNSCQLKLCSHNEHNEHNEHNDELLMGEATSSSRFCLLCPRVFKMLFFNC